MQLDRYDDLPRGQRLVLGKPFEHLANRRGNLAERWSRFDVGEVWTRSSWQ